jgi:hypothetical protein
MVAASIESSGASTIKLLSTSTAALSCAESREKESVCKINKKYNTVVFLFISTPLLFYPLLSTAQNLHIKAGS